MFPDPFDILRDHDPVAVATLPDASSVQARALLARITASPRPPARRFHIRPAVAVAAVAVLATAAAWAVLSRNVTEPSAVTCYQEVSLDGPRVGLRPETTPSADACAEPWTSGQLTSPAVPPGSVPALTGCVTETGALAVFPSDDPDTCRKLGLAAVEPGPQSGIDPVIELQDRLVAYFSSSGCVDLDVAESQVRSVLTDLGLTEWTIQRQPGPADRPCASFGLDANARRIMLVPIPGASG